MNELPELYDNVIVEEMAQIDRYLNSKVDTIIARTKTKRSRETIKQDLRLTYVNLQKGRNPSEWSKGLREYMKDKNSEGEAQGEAAKLKLQKASQEYSHIYKKQKRTHEDMSAHDNEVARSPPVEEESVDDYSLPAPRAQLKGQLGTVPKRFLALAARDRVKVGQQLLQIIEDYAYIANTILGARFFGILQIPENFWSVDLAPVTVPKTLVDVVDGVLSNGADRAQITNFYELGEAVFGEELSRRRERGPARAISNKRDTQRREFTESLLAMLSSVGLSRRKFPFENWESFATENRVQIVNWPIFEGQQRSEYFSTQALRNKSNFALIYDALKSKYESTRLKIRKVSEIEIELDEGFRTIITVSHPRTT